MFSRAKAGLRAAAWAAILFLLEAGCIQQFPDRNSLVDEWLIYYALDFCLRSESETAETRFVSSYMFHIGSQSGNGTTLTSATFGNTGGAGTRYHGAILGSNGMVYGIPRDNSQVIEINPDARTVAGIGGAVGGGTAYLGGASAANGKIYAPPYNAANVLEIDPGTGTTSVFTGTLSGANRYDSAVRAPNGKIYAIPTNIGIQFLEIDPAARTAVMFGTSPVSVGSAYSSAGLGPNGLIYAMPYAAAQILELDPATRAFTLYGSFTPGPAKWSGLVVGLNGNLYGIPIGGNPVLEFNPYTKAIAAFGSGFFAGGGVLLPGGLIYAFPNGLIDPVNRTVTTVAALPSTGYNGGRLALNGKIYLMPDSVTTVAEISTGSAGRFCRAALLSPYMNKSM